MREALRALLQAAAARNQPPRREDPNRVRPRVRRSEAMISYSLCGTRLVASSAMQRALICDHLDRAERHVVAGRKRITEQLEFIAWLAWFGNDATGAKALLREFERGLAKHIVDRERLRTQLALVNGTSASRAWQASYKLSGQGLPDINQFDDQLGRAVVNG